MQERDISNIVKEFLDRMGFTDSDVCVESVQGRMRVDIVSSSARELIGEKGADLACFQHVIRKMSGKKMGVPVLLDIDINSYKKMRESVLSDFAKELRERVCSKGSAIELDPMPAYDRRIIHLTLAGFSDVTTQSVGEGYNRYIVVRPYP